MLSALLGRGLLRHVLRRYFTDLATALVLTGLVLATTYFQYAVFDEAMTHSPLFTLYALLLWLTVRWHERPGRRRALAIGLTLGLLTLLYPQSSRPSRLRRPARHRRNRDARLGLQQPAQLPAGGLPRPQPGPGSAAGRPAASRLHPSLVHGVLRVGCRQRLAGTDGVAQRQSSAPTIGAPAQPTLHAPTMEPRLFRCSPARRCPGSVRLSKNGAPCTVDELQAELFRPKR